VHRRDRAARRVARPARAVRAPRARRRRRAACAGRRSGRVRAGRPRAWPRGARAGDPEGYEPVDLGDASEFARMEPRDVALLRGADYDEEVTIHHHSAGRNEYLVARTVLTADLVINVPKIKTHKKTGVTLS